ncbi:DUF4342 domain-containing protein [Haloimpatiens lingqiaonensis]|uniref:DUF4342 domain-containing protein n=1 Tax=Haloimpatiens lingqiaonensis TaxID=1380675 RepID=UPI0010FE27E7|nr:DUF4342 domain-containing protein [Haloimpatiens lingqiaonensis]
MSEVTLEKIDMIRERTGVSYTEAKEALEACSGDVVEALVYIESNKKESSLYTTKEEFIAWMKELIKKGQVTRIKIKKDDKVLVDMPVNAGVAAGVISLIWWPIAATLVVTAVVAKITIEITKQDGTVEVVNKIIKTKASEVKDIVKDAGCDIKEKINSKMNKDNCEQESENVYQYTVNFNQDEKKDDN